MIHRRQAVPHPPSTQVRSNPCERIAPHTRQREWLSHSQGAVHQIPIGADQGQTHAVAAQPPHTKQPLDAGDPATADHNVERPNRDHAPDASSNCSLYRNTGRRHGPAQTAVNPRPITAPVSCTGPYPYIRRNHRRRGDKHRLRAARGKRLAGSRDDRRTRSAPQWLAKATMIGERDPAAPADARACASRDCGAPEPARQAPQSMTV